MSSDVSLASQTHQAPHIGLPHIAPVQSDKKQKIAPVGANAAVIIPDRRVLKVSPKKLQNAIAIKMTIDIQDAGTCKKIILYPSPCCASVGAIANPTQRPEIVKISAKPANHGIICPAKR